MKKLIIILLALVMCMTMAACTGEGENTTEAPETTETPVQNGDTTAEAPTETTEAAPAFDGYKVTVTDEEGKPIADVQIQMCDSVGCRMPKGTGADGTVTFTFDESDFHVLIAAAVEGYVVDTAEEYWFENGSKEMTIVLKKAN